jgi:hypothetical protein
MLVDFLKGNHFTISLASVSWLWGTERCLRERKGCTTPMVGKSRFVLMAQLQSKGSPAPERSIILPQGQPIGLRDSIDLPTPRKVPKGGAQKLISARRSRTRAVRGTAHQPSRPVPAAPAADGSRGGFQNPENGGRVLEAAAPRSCSSLGRMRGLGHFCSRSCCRIPIGASDGVSKEALSGPEGGGTALDGEFTSAFYFFWHPRSWLQLHAAELLGVSNFGAESSSFSRQVLRLSQNLGGAFVYREIEWFVRVRQQGSLQNSLLCSTFTVSASFEFHACFVVKKNIKVVMSS